MIRQATARFRTVAAPALLASAIFVGACSSRPPLPERPTPIAYADTLPIAEPADRSPIEVSEQIRAATSGEVSAGIGPRALFGPAHEALNVDHFDDVPNSAWYERRNRRGSMTPSEVGRGPTTSEGPADGPLTIISAKVEGISPGFNVEDARGDRYVIKFDPAGFLYLSSSAGVISNRLLHAAGYHVPEDYIFHFRFEQLRVEEGATYEDATLIERPLTLEVAREALTRTDTLADGRYVAVASKFVPGPPKGPFFFHGTRKDDPNDWYPHEHRRELRGLNVVSAWINHVDMRFMNTLDAYVPPGYLRHYLIDFAASLGSGTIRPHEPREGLEYNFDLWDTMGRMFTLGFHRAGWESADWEPIHPTVGWLPGGETFDPAAWKPNWPNRAFSLMTDRDAYWGAKLVGSFTDEQIRAAVAAPGLPDPWAADTLATILSTRRDAIVRHWYAKVSPLEAPRLEAADGELQLSFDDLGVCDGPWTRDASRYEWRMDTEGGSREGAGARNGPGTCDVTIRLAGVPGVPAGSVRQLTVRIVRAGSGVEPEPARLYLRRSGGSYEIVGLEH